MEQCKISEDKIITFLIDSQYGVRRILDPGRNFLPLFVFHQHNSRIKGKVIYPRVSNFLNSRFWDGIEIVDSFLLLLRLLVLFKLVD